MTIGAGANIINKMTTGEFLGPDQYSPIKKSEPGDFWPVTYNTSWLRPKLPFKGPGGRELFLDLVGQADTFIRAMTDPLFAAQSRLSQPAGAGLQVAQQRTFFNEEKLETLRDYARFALEQVSPIPAAGQFEESRRIGRFPGGFVQGLGLNVSAESLSSLRNRTAKEDPDFGNVYEELSRQKKMDYRQKYPEHFAVSQDLPEGTPIQQAIALSEERNEKIAALGQQLEANDIDGRTYGENRSDILMGIAARRSEIPRGDYKPKTDEEKAADAYYRGLEFERGGYWDAEKLIWKSMRDSLPELAKYDTFDDFEKSLVDMAVKQGIPRDFITGTDMMGSFPIIEKFRQMRADFRDFLINQNPKLGRLGLKWGWIARVRKGTAPVLFGE
jgi:hypothetical protein